MSQEIIDRLRNDNARELGSQMAQVARLFVTAGGWSFIQWVTEPDPNLKGLTPIDALVAGDFEDVMAAATAYTE